jgi:hypothetical protein
MLSLPHNQLMNTLILLPDYKKSEANMSQSQSLLLTKLPPELRLMIWDHALDACTLHFDCVDGHFQSVWCDDANDATKLGFRHACWNAHRFISREGRRPIAKTDCPTAQVRGRLSLLLTCKILYVQTDKQTGRDMRQTLTEAEQLSRSARHGISTHHFRREEDACHPRAASNATRRHFLAPCASIASEHRLPVSYCHYHHHLHNHNLPTLSTSATSDRRFRAMEPNLPNASLFEFVQS